MFDEQDVHLFPFDLLAFEICAKTFFLMVTFYQPFCTKTFLFQPSCIWPFFLKSMYAQIFMFLMLLSVNLWINFQVKKIRFKRILFSLKYHFILEDSMVFFQMIFSDEKLRQIIEKSKISLININNGTFNCLFYRTKRVYSKPLILYKFHLLGSHY